MKGSVKLALGLAAAVVVWMASGLLPRTGAEHPAAPPNQAGDHSGDTVRAPAAMTVGVLDLAARPVPRELVLQGQLEPRRRVAVRAETAGLVTALPLERGERVAAGALLARLAEEDRAAQIARAEAAVTSGELLVGGQRNLRERGLQIETDLKAAEAELAAARAELERLRLDLARTAIRAPFAGVLEARPVELGSLVERGDPVADLVDDQVLLAIGHAPQQGIARLQPGQPVTVQLLDGRRAEGRLSFVARVAAPGTRSFRVEAEIPNPDAELPGGVSAELRILLGTAPAHLISPAVLTLDDLGQVGVKSVGADGRVAFHPVAVVRADTEGVWVEGLPAQVRVIVQGQGFVAVGEPVEAVVAQQPAAALDRSASTW